jgi:2-C-methyl-D-erythritol 4-phosphate cytidylyltransferase
VAAGRSQRMGFDKLLTPLGGRPSCCIRWSGCCAPGCAGGNHPGHPPGQRGGNGKRRSRRCASQGNIRLVDGGAQRQDSVQAGLKAVSDSSEYVMVHDAARPFVTKELIDVVLAAAKLSDAAVCGAPCSDSLKEVARTAWWCGRSIARSSGRCKRRKFSAPSCCARPTRRP